MKSITDITDAIRKRLGLGNDVQTSVRLHLPTEPEETTVTVGRFVKTEFETPCADCGEDDRYFHQYWDHRGRFGKTRKLRCHDCYVDVYGEQTETPLPSDSDETPNQSAVYDSIDPRDAFPSSE